MFSSKSNIKLACVLLTSLLLLSASCSAADQTQELEVNTKSSNSGAEMNENMNSILTSKTITQRVHQSFEAQAAPKGMVSILGSVTDFSVLGEHENQDMLLTIIVPGIQNDASLDSAEIKFVFGEEYSKILSPSKSEDEHIYYKSSEDFGASQIVGKKVNISGRPALIIIEAEDLSKSEVTDLIELVERSVVSETSSSINSRSEQSGSTPVTAVNPWTSPHQDQTQSSRPVPEAHQRSQLQRWLSGKQLINFDQGAKSYTSYCSKGRYINEMHVGSVDPTMSYTSQSSFTGTWRAEGSPQKGVVYMTIDGEGNGAEAAMAFSTDGQTGRFGDLLVRVEANNPHCT